MTNESAPWEQQEGEPNRWFQRFNAYRLAGPGRSLEAVYSAECEAKLSKVKRPSRLWYEAAETWQWKARAQAWDQHLTNLADAEVEARWRDRIMGETEVLGRMSEFGRNDVRNFFKATERWTENPLPSEEILEEEEFVKTVDGKPVVCTRYKVKKVVLDMDAFLDPEMSFRVRKFSDSPKNGLSFELYDAPAALVNVGKHNGALAEKDRRGDGNSARVLTIPADLIAPPFLAAYRDIRDRKHTEYVFYGGRGSTKSSFVSLAIIWLLVSNPTLHALALRQVANTLRDSVYAQLVWAINELSNYFPGLADDFKCITTPLEIEYRPTGQKIYFRGADDEGKIKSIKPAFGHIGIAWFEELDQFHGEEGVRKIEQSVIRGGDLAFIFKSFNPPRTVNNWANKYVKIPKASRLLHHSSYTDVPPEWLGKPWLDEAEFLKQINPQAYEHEYLGLANGTGGMVFENVQIRKITDEEIAQFDRVLHGLDWGYFPDPAHYTRCHYDAARHTLYIFGEYRAWKTSNRVLYDALMEMALTPEDMIIADSAEPKSVADFRQYSADGRALLDAEGRPVLERGKPVMVYGPSCRPAEKGPESVKYSMKWLQSLTAIVIDNERCPYAADEFLAYEYEQDKDGNYISEYPDRDNHAIDSTRYGTNMIWKRRGQ